MCVYSMVMDDWNRRNGTAVEPLITGDYFKIFTDDSPAATKKDLDELREEFRKELRSLKKLLKAAAQYDEESGQPDCEQEEKIALIRKLAEGLGVDMEDCLPKKPTPTPICETPGTRLVKELEKALRSDAIPCNTTISVGDTTITTPKPPAFSENVSWVTTSDVRPSWSVRDDGSDP